MNGLVYINHGRVIVDCPFGCGNAYLVNPGETTRVCESDDGCLLMFDLIMPAGLDEIVSELAKRPNRANRNWFPTGHPIAEQLGCPVDQTPQQLSEEYAEHGMDSTNHVL